MGALAPVPRICGRETEIGVLGEALDRVAAGGPAVVLVEGEAGIGKTRLLAQVLQDAAGRGMQVAAGRAEELERTRPFGLLAAALGCARSSPDPRRAAIAGLLAAQGTGDLGPITVTSDPGLRFRVVDAFTDLVEELALAGPVVLGLDDLQWADPSSLLTVGALARRLAGLAVGVIGCLRPSPRTAELDRLAGALAAVGARHLVLRPLTGEAVTGLVAQAVAAEPGPRLLAEVSGAAGNPLFITELLAALAQEGAIMTAGGRAEVADTVLPPTLRLTILRRVSFLPEPALQALGSASILGSGFSLTDLAIITGRPAVDLSVVLGEAIRARVLEDDGARLRFRHELIRDAIYEDLAGSVRRGLHREAGQRLAQAGAPALQVAEHFARGAPPGDPEAVTWLARAAREAAPRSPDVAADLLGRAAGLMAPGDPGRDGLLAERATSLMWAGRITDAETACRSLLGRDLDPSLEGAVRICLGHVLLAGGQARDGLCELERACQSPLLTGAERAEAQAWASLARLVLADLAGAAAAAAQARPVAVAARDPLTTSVAMVSLAQVSELRGDLGDALRIIDDAVRLADGSPGRLGHRFPVHDFRAYILITLGRLDEANSSLETGMRISEELGTRWALAHYHAGRALERFLAGHWDDAVAEIETDTGLAGAPGESYHHLLVRRGVLSLIRLHRNDLPGARDAVGAAPGELPGTGRATCRPAGPSSGPPPAPAARPASTASSTAEPPASPPPTAPSTPPRCPTATCRSPPRSTQASNDAPASRSGDLQLTEAGIDLAPAAAAARNLRARKKGITVVRPSNQDLGGVVRGRRRRGSYALPPPRQLLKVREPPIWLRRECELVCPATAHRWLLRASTALMSPPSRAPASFSRGDGLSLESAGRRVRVDLYSVVCVRDRVTSQKWFEVFFGRPADEVIGEEYLWQVGANAWVVIDDRDVRAARVGGAMITLGVTDLNDILARLAAHGIGHEPVETYGNGVRHVEVLDPDGNSLSLAEVAAR